MSAVWQCGRCFALHFAGEHVCRRCGAPRPVPSVPAITQREPDSEAVHLHLPPTDFPYSRRARLRERRRIAPYLFFVVAAVIAFAWDPVVRRVAAGRALGGESTAAVQARRTQLSFVTKELSTLLTERTNPRTDLGAWRERVRALGPRWRLVGDPDSPALGDLEVRVRSVWLEVASLPDDAGAVGPHVTVAREELSRVSEDLSHAR